MASALVDYARWKSVEPKPDNVSEFQIHAGEGIYGKIDGCNIYIGNKRIVTRAGCPTGKILLKSSVPTTSNVEEGVTVGYVFCNAAPIGIFTLSDTCRTGAAEAIRELKSLGVKTAMLTGDSTAAALNAQNQLGNVIEMIHAELLPEDKVRIVGELKSKGGSTLMVGDGMNDAPALAMANVGISMGISGSAVAMETSHITLMSNDIGKIPKAIQLARRANRKIILNIVFSVITKVAILTLAFSGHPILWAAVLADVGTCLIVILNSMTLLRTKDKTKKKCCSSKNKVKKACCSNENKHHDHGKVHKHGCHENEMAHKHACNEHDHHDHVEVNAQHCLEHKEHEHAKAHEHGCHDHWEEEHAQGCHEHNEHAEDHEHQCHDHGELHEHECHGYEEPHEHECHEHTGTEKKEHEKASDCCGELPNKSHCCSESVAKANEEHVIRIPCAEEQHSEKHNLCGCKEDAIKDDGCCAKAPVIDLKAQSSNCLHLNSKNHEITVHCSGIKNKCGRNAGCSSVGIRRREVARCCRSYKMESRKRNNCCRGAMQHLPEIIIE